MRRRAVIGIIIALTIGGLVWWTDRTIVHQNPSASRNQKGIMLGGVVIDADVADTEALRERGLSGRAELSDSQGMLFIFQEEGTHSFWMKDMLLPLDIIWLSKDERVVYIQKNATPQSYPTTFTPKNASGYVIEVPAGWTDRHRVTIGSKAAF